MSLFLVIYIRLNYLLTFFHLCNSLIFHSFFIPWVFKPKKDLDLERFPSGQRGQTVNLLAMPSEVRILPSPPDRRGSRSFRPFSFFSSLYSALIESNKSSGCGCLFISAKVSVNLQMRIWSSGKVCILYKSGSSSVGRASAFQAEGRGFDPRFPLHCNSPSTSLRANSERPFFTPSSKAGRSADLTPKPWRCRMGQNDMVDKFSNLFGQPVVFNWQGFLYFWPT